MSHVHSLSTSTHANYSAIVSVNFLAVDLPVCNDVQLTTPLGLLLMLIQDSLARIPRIDSVVMRNSLGDPLLC